MGSLLAGVSVVVADLALSGWPKVPLGPALLDFVVGVGATWCLYLFVRFVILGFVVGGFRDTKKVKQAIQQSETDKPASGKGHE